MDETTIIVERGAGYRVVTLNRPDRLNSFNEAMHRALAAALEEAAGDGQTRALLLTGTGRAFCAGQDLSDRVTPTGGTPPDLSRTIERFYNPLVRRLRSLPFPVVCAVNGTAAGAGANLAFACDIVLAARSARFIQAFSSIGLVPDTGGTWFLPRLVGEARARALMMLGQPVAAEQAEAWGMIWRMVEDDALAAEARRITGHLATQATAGFGLLKKALARTWSNDLDAQLDLERDLQGDAGRTPDYAEGVRAFIEKRRPAFTGRS